MYIFNENNNPFENFDNPFSQNKKIVKGGQRLNETYQAVMNDIELYTEKKPKIIMAPRELTEITGSIESSIILSQLLYWQDKTKNPDMWIFKSYKDWILETGLKKCQILKARRILEDKLKIVETITKKVRGAPTLHYRLKIEALTKLIRKYYMDLYKIK